MSDMCNVNAVPAGGEHSRPKDGSPEVSFADPMHPRHLGQGTAVMLPGVYLAGSVFGATCLRPRPTRGRSLPDGLQRASRRADGPRSPHSGCKTTNPEPRTHSKAW